MKTNLIIPLILISFIALQSCATIFGGRYNTLSFSGDSLPIAKVYIDGKYVGDAPGRLKLKKSLIQHGSKLEIRAEGYKTIEYRIFRKQHTIYTILDILTAGTGLAVDYATGNIYRPVPHSFRYKLENVN